MAEKNRPEKKYRPELIDLREVGRLSYFDNGPLLVKEHLEKAGVCFLTIPHLAKTYLDGAAMILENQLPVIALTLRYKRIDNFWFCLLHELAHLISHLSDKENEIFLDELEPRRIGKREEDPKEKEADAIAQIALIPEDTWNTIDLNAKNLEKEVIRLSETLKIHPAIVAGRIRYEKNNYRLLTQFIGKDQIQVVRKNHE